GETPVAVYYCLCLPYSSNRETFNLIFEPAKIHTYFKRMTDDNKSDLLEVQKRGLGEKGLSYMAGFFMLVAFGLGGTLLGGLLGIPVAAAMSGKSIAFITENLQQLTSDGSFLREMQVIQTFSAAFGFLLPTLFAASRLSYEPV